MGEVTFPVALVSISLSDATVESVMVSLAVGLETGDEMGVFVNVGSTDMVGTAVGLLNMELGVPRGSGRLMDKLNDRLSPNKPRTLLCVVNKIHGMKGKMVYIVS